MREIVLDTETTGLKYQEGDKILEIGCVELKNRLPTGREFHCYLDPERDIPEASREIHGIDEAFVKGKPIFSYIADDFLNFLGDAVLVIHNAPFDLGFLNAELEACAKPRLSPERVCDSLVLAQEKYRAERVSLDALCRRYGIDLSQRKQHGALLDARLLAKVYLELIGGRQKNISLSSENPQAYTQQHVLAPRKPAAARAPLQVITPSSHENAAHVALLNKINKNKKNN